MRNITVRQLQMFVAAANARSFARASETLHVSPATISFQIKRLEDMSGFALFERSGRTVALTDTRLMLQALLDADRALMARFQTAYSEVAINLRFGNRQQITEALDRREIEQAVMG